MYYEVNKTAKILKELRKRKNVTQEQVAEDIGLNIKTLQAAEQGTRGVRIDTLCEFADYYKVTLDYLITGVNEEREFGHLLDGLSCEQKDMLYGVVSNMIATMKW